MDTLVGWMAALVFAVGLIRYCVKGEPPRDQH